MLRTANGTSWYVNQGEMFSRNWTFPYLDVECRNLSILLSAGGTGSTGDEVEIHSGWGHHTTRGLVHLASRGISANKAFDGFEFDAKHHWWVGIRYIRRTIRQHGGQCSRPPCPGWHTQDPGEWPPVKGSKLLLNCRAEGLPKCIICTCEAAKWISRENILIWTPTPVSSDDSRFPYQMTYPQLHCIFHLTTGQSVVYGRT